MNDDNSQIALQLARMYGVAETLNPVKHLDNIDFVTMMQKWSQEFVKSDEKDVVAYFEKRFQMCEKEN